MTMHIEEVLSAICNEVRLTTENDYQQIFFISGPKQAKLALDLLLSYGVDAKSYPEDHGARLYVVRESLTAFPFPAAKAYAALLKSIHQTLEDFQHSPAISGQKIDPAITFANALNSGKQLSISLSPAQEFAYAEKTVNTAPAPSQVKSVTATKRRLKSEADEMQSFQGGGPAVGKQNLPEYKAAAAASNNMPDGLLKQMRIYIKGNMATTSYYILQIIVGVAIILTILVFMRGFLCPDFAVDQSKNRA